MDETRKFYDELAATYDLIYSDWGASIAAQGAALDRLLTSSGVVMAEPVLDAACGIGTQTLGLAALGWRMTGSDLSPAAVTRAHVEATSRSLEVGFAVADMRSLPFPDSSFAALVCADNSLPHLMTPADLAAGLREFARVLRPGGVLLVSTRDYDAIRAGRPGAAPPSVRRTATGRVITFQIWHWHEDGERYDLEHFQVIEDRDEYRISRRTGSYWALTRPQLTEAFAAAGLETVSWQEPSESGFFQPVAIVRRP